MIAVFRLYLRLSVIVLAALLGMISPACAESGANVVLVLDASGSMWSRIGDKTKIEIARETVGTILQTWRSQDKLGLVVYGHRRKGDCSDIETLKPLGPVDPAAFLAEVGAISPKGRTPMTEAVRLAADQLKGVEDVATVILVSDGIETCDADPCAVAASLKAADVHLVVHTIGFDIQDPEATRQLACMASATGGLALTASDAKDLTIAIQQAVYTAQKEPPPTEAPPPLPSPPRPAPAAYNLVGSVRLSEGDDPIAGKDNVTWVFRLPGSDGQRGQIAALSYSSRIERQLDPGTYDVTVEAGSATATGQVTIVTDQVNQLDVVLNAGRLGLRAKRTETENQLGDVSWEVHSKTDGKLVFFSSAPETSTIIPAGGYTVDLAIGAAKQSRDIDVPPGETTAVEIVAGVGHLSGLITLAKGGPPLAQAPLVDIYSGATRVPGERSVNDTYIFDSKPELDLAAGTYRLNVHGGGIDQFFPFTIEPGQKLTMEFALDAGLVAIAAPGVDSVTIAKTSEGTDAKSDDIDRLYPPYGDYALPAGSYRFTGHWGDVTVDAIAQIVAGRRVELSLKKP